MEEKLPSKVAPLVKQDVMKKSVAEKVVFLATQGFDFENADKVIGSGEEAGKFVSMVSGNGASDLKIQITAKDTLISTAFKKIFGHSVRLENARWNPKVPPEEATRNAVLTLSKDGLEELRAIHEKHGKDGVELSDRNDAEVSRVMGSFVSSEIQEGNKGLNKS